MAFRLGSTVARLIASAACLGLVLGTAACSSDNTEGTVGSDDAQTSKPMDEKGSVAIFTPSDGVTISQSTPLNKWTKFVPALVKALRDGGMAKDDIDTATADSLDRQSRDIQDYVVDHVSSDSGKDADASSVTLVVAPVTDTSQTISQYGDYISRSIADGSSSGDDDESNSTDDEAVESEAVNRLVSSLELAQESGMHVVMVSGMVDGFHPDAYVQMSTAELIGTLQARKMADKLELDSASTDNPKSIEVLLPYDAGSDADGTDEGTDGRTSSDPADATASQTLDVPEDDAEFVQEAFAGIWSVLQPYFAQGKAVSPSGTLTADTTKDDWESVAFADDGKDATKRELRQRLGMDADSDSHTRIDGIIAMNDYAASDVIAELEALGYTGSSADINPSITISGIVENITGKKDLKRDSVPDPIKAPETADDGSSGTDSDNAAEREDIEKINRRWPIVTGYGAYVDSIPQIVNGQQWMTALENREALAEDTATACLLLNTGAALAGKSFVKTTKVKGKSLSVISEELLSVSASNLKETLIDPGYITLAEAGL